MRRSALLFSTLLFAVQAALTPRTKTTVRRVTSASTSYGGPYWRGVVTTHTHRKPPKTYIERDPETGAYYEVTEHAIVHRHMHKRLTAGPATPTQCNCKVDRSPNNSKCYYYTVKGATTCMSRPCRNRHICVAQRTGIVCIKRKLTKKIVPVPGVTGYCRNAPASGYIYVPYTSY